MTPFVLLIVVLGLFSTAWLARPYWLPTVAPTAGDTTPASHAHRSLGVAALLAVFVVMGPLLGSLLLDAPSRPDEVPAPVVPPPIDSMREARETLAASARDGGTDPVAQAEARVATMVERLAERLKARPADADGWRTLGHSYAALGRHAQAVEAFKSAARLHPNDATLLAEYAFSAAVTDPHGTRGEAAQLVERALQIDPKNAKALALAGTLAVDRKDYQGAVRHWEALAQVEVPDSPTARQVQASILQARQLAVARSGAASPPDLAALGSPRAQVSGTVTLSPALLASVAPDDTVLVFARSPKGPRMPLAVLRKQVKDLPLRFTLDDQLSTSPGAKLSTAASVVVGARVARSGSTMARDGDLQGRMAAVAVGRSDVHIEINEVVRVR